jgi:hypothetical protein
LGQSITSFSLQVLNKVLADSNLLFRRSDVCGHIAKLCTTLPMTIALSITAIEQLRDAVLRSRFLKSSQANSKKAKSHLRRML